MYETVLLVTKRVFVQHLKASMKREPIPVKGVPRTTYIFCISLFLSLILYKLLSLRASSVSEGITCTVCGPYQEDTRHVV